MTEERTVYIQNFIGVHRFTSKTETDLKFQVDKL